MSDANDSHPQGMAEDELSENDRQLRLLVENMGDVISRHLPDSTFTYVSPSCRVLLGYTPEELVRTRAADYVHPDDLRAVIAAINHAVERHDEHYRVRHRMKRKDGRCIWVETVGRLSYGPAGHLREIQCVARDITEGKQAEEALRQSETKFRGLVEAYGDWIWEVGAEGVYTHASPKVEAILGYKPDEVVGKTPFDLMPAEEAARIEEVFKDAARKGEPIVALENVNLHRDGRRIVIETSGVPILDAEGKIAGYRGVDRDITERRRIEKEREQLITKLEQANETLKAEIAERKEAEDELRRMEYIVSGSTDMLAMLDENHVYLAANEAYLKAFGKTHDELIGHTAAEIFGQEFFDATVRPNAERCLAGEDVRYEDWFDFPVAGRQYMDIGYSPYTNEDQQIKGFVVSGRIATERKRADEALRESEARFRNLFEDAPDANMLLADGILVDCNQAALSMLRGSREQVVGLSPVALSPEFQPDGSRSAVKAAACVREAMETGSGLFEWVHRRLDGTEIWVEVAATAIVYRGQRTLFGTWRDITERKRAEEALRNEKEFTETALSSQQDTFFLFESATGRAIRWNRAFRDATGYTDEEIAAMTSPDSYYSPEDLERARLFIPEVLETGKGVIELEVICKDGRRIPTEYNVSVVKNEQGVPKHLISIGRDISERKQAEEAREALIAKLEAQNAELERFAYTVSHDLKSPLITIQGYVGMLRRDLARGGSETVGDDLARISSAADKMDQLLRDLLELSRIGRLINPSENVSLEEVAREALELVGGQVKENRVQVEISPDLPLVFGDRVRLLEVLQNLIDNAVKYMGDTSEPRVEIGSRRGGNQAICYVRDNGIGIEPRYHERVFGLFDQLDQSVEGSGIGLALVKRIVEVHGGRIWIESEGSGHGSTFCFTVTPNGQST